METWKLFMSVENDDAFQKASKNENLELAVDYFLHG